MTKEVIFPYDYLSIRDPLEERALPAQDVFNSKLLNKQYTNEEYSHVKQVWKTFNCKNIWVYMQVYLITDILLLTDIFENFRKIYGLDPCHYRILQARG